jgi:serine phosphatase RsbU (regulator of sigma subunit)
MNFSFRRIFFFLVFAFPALLHASRTDSLKALLPNAPDTEKINIYIRLAYSTKNFSEVKDYFAQAVHLADSLKLDKKIYRLQSDQGVIYEKFGELQPALQFYMNALDKATALHDSDWMGDTYLNISWLYFEMKKYDMAEKDGLIGLGIFEKRGDKPGIGNACNNLATYKKDQNKFDEALAYHKRALAIRHELNDARGLSYTLNNIGLVYLKMEKYPESIDYLNQSYHLKDSLHDVKGMAGSLINISNAYIGTKEFDKALDFALRGTKLADSSGNKIFLKNGYDAVAHSYEGTGQFEKADEYFKKYIELNQKLLDEANLKQVNEMQAKYESDKQEQKIALQNVQNTFLKADLDRSEALVNRKNIIIYLVSGGGLLLIILALVILRGLRQKKKTLVFISGMRDKLEQKNQEISDSINYAKNIQRSLLPDPSQLRNVFRDSFVLNMPKDIVSGDFFSLVPRENKFYLAVADCTGHGVPGAFMSMIGIDKLNQAIAESKTGKPGEILSLLNKSIRASLHQEDWTSLSKDGMDIALISVEFGAGSSERKITYAGANRPLWIIRNGNFIEFKPTKAAIGGITLNESIFADNEISLEENDQVYLFSDGFPDQFGGVKGKKLMTKHFRTLLMNASQQSLAEQKEFLLGKLKEWQGGFEQVDDILVVGVKV